MYKCTKHILAKILKLSYGITNLSGLNCGIIASPVLYFHAAADLDYNTPAPFFIAYGYTPNQND